ncbi:aminodeoxychorismate synthase, component I [Formosimonas limnophila]|uniref:Aminodeoxychorismate synthase, component I n=1 Tax=Formosimonas limnophila TaxID=1384487 RepID=A0A8J3FYJ6_9BURK|nr:chorismate-binding protein [Formosimonas limnophila]GHA73734.1 aminodeoxychorismate synthase, component I [Formosimonas limnophila]
MMRHLSDCSALLFDGSHADAVSRLFVGGQHSWCVTTTDGVAALHQALSEIDDATRKGADVVLSMSYDAWRAFSVADGLVLSEKPHIHDTPWLQAIQFNAPTQLSRREALDWLHRQANSATTHLCPVKSLVDEATFVEHIHTIRSLITAGDTYQVNYTFPLTSELISDTADDAALAAVYHQLAQDLRIPYGAFLMLPHSSVLSFSPELFVEMTPTALTCRPMKGTGAVADNDVENTRRAALLAADPKNRAENLMIVDLMRNDLSRLPQTSRVTVPKLFDVKRYGTVLQMTSTVKAHLTHQPSLSELFNALFPCGSITGAPKRRTIEIIDELESHQRGAYCGAIGHIEPAGNNLINATFAVPIRTIETCVQPTMNFAHLAHWQLRLSVGAGITFDSNPEDEWQESWLKAKFFTQHTQVFELIETMRVEPSSSIPLFAAHMARLTSSAKAMNWPAPDISLIHQHIHQAIDDTECPHEPFLRLRLSLTADGQINIHITKPETIAEPVYFGLAKSRTQSTNPLLIHKTTARAVYNAALSQAKSRGLFDLIFLNEKGQLTEGARSNLFIQKNGLWYTPPISCGVLAGIQRGQLITELSAQEKILHEEDLRAADQVILCNALYGSKVASLVD